MAASPKRLSWDACAWIALIQDEKRPLESGKTEHRGQMCRMVMTTAERSNGAIEVLASTLCLAEVCKDKSLQGLHGDEAIRAYFDHPHILLVTVDRQVGEYARKLLMAGYAGLKPPDAIHVASAIIGKAEQLHTFDHKLLAMDGKVIGLDGVPLRICKPEMPSATSAPLLENS